jgi:hypothetical protein
MIVVYRDSKINTVIGFLMKTGTERVRKEIAESARRLFVARVHEFQ